MSVALYRKYRPGTFAEVRGQEHVTEPLQQALRAGRVHHAYLFSGPRGCGKTSSARILARSLNCERGPTPEPCGECEPCLALAPAGPGSIDVIEIDAASHGGVDDARDLRERAFFTPAASRYKVYVIDEAHMVTREGFNALLKLVEEPPPHLKFVFATTEPDKVIGTIRSRTHHYPFRLLPPSLLRDLLADVSAEEGIEVEPAALPLVVRAGAGSVRDALSILDQILAGASEGRITYAQTIGLLGYTDTSLLDEVVEAFAAGNGAAVFEAVNRVIEGGHDPRRFATDLLERFRDLVMLRAVPDAGAKGLLDHPPDQLERMVTQAGRMGAAELSRAADLFHEGLTEMRGATSPRLLLELICARVLLPGAAKDESALLGRLERLERRMSIETRGGATAQQAEPEAPRPARSAAAESPGSSLPPEGRSAATTGGQPSKESAGETEEDLAGTEPPSVPSAASGDREEPAGSAPAPEPEPEPEPASESSPSSLDVAAVRRTWPDVLEDVKNRRRVAWMILIGDVQVASVDQRSLTLAFAKEGDRKGFMSSGCDRILQQSLYEVLGVRWEVQTTSGSGAPSPASPDAPAPAGATSPVGSPGPEMPSPEPASAEVSPEPASPEQASPEPASPEQVSPEQVSPEVSPEPASPEQVSPEPPSGATPAGAASPAEDSRAEPHSPGTPAPAATDGSATDHDAARTPSRAGPGSTGTPGSTPAAAGLAVSTAAAEGAAADLSGMALVQRELGAEVIEEIDDP